MIASDLNRLREKDPATWQRAIGGMPLKGGKYLSVMDAEPQLACAWLQAVLQDAIRARGWAYWTGYTGTNAFAEIHKRGALSTQGDKMQQAGDSPAEALLAAYLEAIR